MFVERRAGGLRTCGWRLLAVALSACACSESSPEGSVNDSVVNCELDPRVDKYTDNLVKSSNGLVVTLISSDPAPPARGNNTWRIRVADSSGNAITHAPIDVEPFMPDHGHGTSVVPMVTAGEDGTYDIAPLNLFMPGVWRASISDAEDVGASVAFHFCIVG